MLKKLRKDEKGFTLVELMTVVIIIGILVAIAVPQFAKQSDKARIGRAEAEMSSVGKVLQIYYAENNHYPASTDLPAFLQQNGINWAATSSKYIDPWGNGYIYAASASSPTSYILYCMGPSGNFGDSTNKQNISLDSSGKWTQDNITAPTGTTSDSSSS